MKTKTLVSSFAIMTALSATTLFDSYAAARISNKSRSYADAYSQVGAMSNSRSDDATAGATNADGAVNPAAVAVKGTTTLPVRVANPTMAQRIASGDESMGVGVHTLEKCSKIYPNGEFAWDTPTAGIGRGGASTCVAVVEMRASNAAPDGGDLVLARANVAAGSTAKCNISEFPQYGYTDAAYNFVFPADNPPTMEDVVKVLNAEQKQNAGFKIAASALIGVIGGNMVGKNDLGHDGMFGTDKGKVQGSVIGGLAGAAIGAGNAYGGKVGGDMILSGGVNAAAGGIMANAMASGDSVLRIEECDIDGRKTTCLWGYVMDTSNRPVYEDKNTNTKVPYNLYYDMSEKVTSQLACDEYNTNCKTMNLVNITFDGYNSVEAARKDKFNKITTKYYQIKDPMGANKVEANATAPENAQPGVWVKIKDASEPGKRYPAMIPDFKDGTFGKTDADWNKWKEQNSNAKIVARGKNGAADTIPSGSKVEFKIANFFPIYISTDDGSVIDLGNKARMKTTMVGAGAGGALGAFSAYQGAQSDISERWVAAQREYEDSLSTVYCATGQQPTGRFLASYNADFEIPEMPE